MFAVEGWKLGQIVAQTAPKKKLKRKRDEKDEATTNNTEKTEKHVRVNPFAIGNATKQSTKAQKKAKKQAASEIKAAEAAEKLVKPADDAPVKPAISMRQAARDRAAKKLLRQLQQSEANTNTEITSQSETSLHASQAKTSSKSSIQTTLTPLQQKMRAKLAGSQFRQINEKLYTTHSSEALSLFTDQPSLFHDVSSLFVLLTIVSPRIPTSSSVLANQSHRQIHHITICSS
jgi:ribosomal RNA-processing protein 8